MHDRDDAVLWTNARIATCDDTFRILDRGAMLTLDGRIEWVGEEPDLPPQLRARAAVHDLGGAWITPGLIDCHTHLVFAGTRAEEYGERLRGATYEQIARRGGGILSTVRAVRAASEQQLFDASAPRLESLLAEGVTAVEIKSGYGLTLEDEAKMLRVARALERHYPVTVRTTLLAAHAVPPEFGDRPDDYIDTVAREWLPRLHEAGLVDAVDVFCERIGFDAAQAERLFAAAQSLGVPLKMHAEQLSRIGGTQLATRYRALSCDHLEYSSAQDAEAMARAGTVAVLLPIAFYCLNESQRPPIEALRAAGARMAIATDCNPGSAPGASLLLAATMGRRHFGLTAAETLAAMTRNAARALGLDASHGCLSRGFTADFIVWSIESLEETGYWLGFNPCRAVVRAGRIVRGHPAARRASAPAAAHRDETG